MPGPMFCLNYAKELALSERQGKSILSIAQEIMPKTIRQGREIDRLKRQVIELSDSRRTLDSCRIRALLVDL